MKQFKFKKTGQIIKTEDKKQIEAWTKSDKWVEVFVQLTEIEVLKNEVEKLKKENAKLKQDLAKAKKA